MNPVRRKSDGVLFFLGDVHEVSKIARYFSPMRLGKK